MLDKNNLVALAIQVANADRNAPAAYSFNGASYDYATLNETLRQELNEYAGTYALYRENKNLIFSVIEETIDAVLPKKVAVAYDQFAEVKQFAQGDKPLFRRKINSRNRAKQFITRVGLAGVYEVFKLGQSTESFEVPTSAIGGAAQIGFEEFLDGRVDFSELIDIVMEGMDDLIYEEIGAALRGAINQLPAKNVVVADDFDEAKFDELLMIASAYGDPTIYCTMEFAIKMLPADAWRYTEAMKDELYRTGRLRLYKGHNVIILPNGFKDETLSEKALDASYCWIIAAGGDTKPVKVAFEGETLIDEWKNHDWSREIQVYKKVGVVAMLSNNICAFRDMSLASMTEWNFSDDVHNTVVIEDGGQGSEGGDNQGQGDDQGQGGNDDQNP
jgi:hypothetical protein